MMVTYYDACIDKPRKIEKAKAAHRRRWGEARLIVSDAGPGRIRLTDADIDSWSEWDITTWRVRRVDDGHPAA